MEKDNQLSEGEEKEEHSTIENNIENNQDNILSILDDKENFQNKIPDSKDITVDLGDNSSIPTSTDLKFRKVDKEANWAELPSYVEAVLFQSGRPITETELIEYFQKFEKFKNVDRRKIRWAIRKISKGLDAQNSTIQLINPTKDFWSYQLNQDFPPEFFEKIQIFLPEDQKFNPEEIKVLTEVAYRQPVKASELSKILETSIFHYLKNLESKGLITMEKDKQTYICETSKKFAELYGFNSELRSLKISLVWRLKKYMKSESKIDKETLEKIRQDKEKYEK